MPSASDSAFNEEDTPDDLKGLKSARKKKQKKGAKQRAADECKDSSSEGPKLSPDLPPVVDHANPSPPPSPPLPARDDQAAENNSPVEITSPPDKASINNAVLPFEPSPPQDGVLAPPFNLPLTINGAQNVPSLSSSPQGGIRLPPNSIQMRTHGASPPAPQVAHPFRERKASMTATGPSPVPRLGTFYDPPPPHMPQRHFTRRPEMELVQPESSAPMAEKGYYCGFDSLERANAGTSPSANNVVLAGSQKGLDVYRLLPQSANLVGRLHGLRGTVIDAKILPWTERHDPFAALRPLIACVVHGPVREDRKDADHSPPSEDVPPNASYQTTVDVYSLVSTELLCTLYETPSAPPHTNSAGREPIGHLQIAAEGCFVTVASGVSGEVYVFAPYSQPIADHRLSFRCIAKLWTSTTTVMSSPTFDGQGSLSDETRKVDSKAAVSALSQRWLAIKPPLLSSSQISLQGAPLLSPSHPDPPGVSSHVSPPPPMTNCEVDAPFNNSFFDRVTKQATQEIRKGAQWVGEQGKQAWKAYWNRPSPPPQGDVPHRIPRQASQSEAGIFPPTHAQPNEPYPSSVEPASISIIDLQKLLEFGENPVKGASAPLATFALPDGCSFMSFAPEGLMLLVTNHVGDASTVWDLSRITNGKLVTPCSLVAAGGVPYVAMAARFARQTPSVVAGVAWSAHGHRLAILTQKGTVHLHELPLSSSSRLMAHVGLGQSPSHVLTPSPGSSPQSDAPVPGFMTSFRARMQTLPGMNFRAPPNPRATVSHASAYARNTGRKALKQGVNMATDTALKFRHHEQTKIRLQPTQHTSCPLSLRWLSGRDSGLIATVLDGKVRLHTVKSNHYEQDKRTVVYLTASRRPVVELSLSATDTASAGWYLNKAHMVQRNHSERTEQFSALVAQDKDTSPTMLPFHRNPQVDLFTFSRSSDSIANAETSAIYVSRGMGSEEAWVFGLPPPPTTRITCQRARLEDDHAHVVSNGGVDDMVAGMPESFGTEAIHQSYGEREGPMFES